MTLFYDEIYSEGLDRTARFPVDRYSRIAENIRLRDKDGLIEMDGKNIRLVDFDRLIKVCEMG